MLYKKVNVEIRRTNVPDYHHARTHTRNVVIRLWMTANFERCQVGGVVNVLEMIVRILEYSVEGNGYGRTFLFWDCQREFQEFPSAFAFSCQKLKNWNENVFGLCSTDGWCLGLQLEFHAFRHSAVGSSIENPVRKPSFRWKKIAIVRPSSSVVGSIVLQIQFLGRIFQFEPFDFYQEFDHVYNPKWCKNIWNETLSSR